MTKKLNVLFLYTGNSCRSQMATVVGVLIEVPVMLMLVKVCLHSRNWFIPPKAAQTVE